jgi:hypothetical protein
MHNIQFGYLEPLNNQIFVPASLSASPGINIMSRRKYSPTSALVNYYFGVLLLLLRFSPIIIYCALNLLCIVN